MDLAKLAAIAAAATQGRREVDYTQDGQAVILIPDFYKTAEPDRRARVLYEGDWATPEDVKFDATFDPETVLELISALISPQGAQLVRTTPITPWVEIPEAL